MNYKVMACNNQVEKMCKGIKSYIVINGKNKADGKSLKIGIYSQIN